jgi:hypothetical protein
VGGKVLSEDEDFEDDRDLSELEEPDQYEEVEIEVEEIKDPSEWVEKTLAEVRKNEYSGYDWEDDTEDDYYDSENTKPKAYSWD